MDNKKIQKIMRKWKEESGATRVIQFKYSMGILTIYTSQPGWLIGKAGVLSNKYRELFESEFCDFKDMRFEETDYYWA